MKTIHKTTDSIGGNNWEQKFIKWAEARDDDWWENGQGHFSIWDFRIILDFFLPEISQERLEAKREIIDAISLEMERELYNLIPNSSVYTYANRMRRYFDSLKKDLDTNGGER